MEEQTSERRQQPRLALMHLISYSNYDEQNTLTTQGHLANIINMNPTGILIEITDPLPLRSTMILDLNISGKAVQAKGSVIHVQETSSHLWRTGIRITEWDGEQVEE
jgi:hypothetical protein